MGIPLSPSHLQWKGQLIRQQTLLRGHKRKTLPRRQEGRTKGEGAPDAPVSEAFARPSRSSPFDVEQSAGKGFAAEGSGQAGWRPSVLPMERG